MSTMNKTSNTTIQITIDIPVRIIRMENDRQDYIKLEFSDRIGPDSPLSRDIAEQVRTAVSSAINIDREGLELESREAYLNLPICNYFDVVDQA